MRDYRDERDFKKMTRQLITAAILLATCVAMIAVTECTFKSSDIYKITFDYDKEQVTVWTDGNGVVKKAKPEETFWHQHVVVNVPSLKDGDIMEMYDLYSDVMSPDRYKVIKVVKD